LTLVASFCCGWTRRLADAERLFSALAEGEQVTMTLQETFWAHHFGMCTDRFGTPLGIST
jgi:uncharacterized glyoxalase superfamily protein PhnB